MKNKQVLFIHIFLVQNTTLLDEQEVLIKHLLEQAKIADQYFSEEEIKRREDVILCMKDKWDRQRELEREIEGKGIDFML